MKYKYILTALVFVTILFSCKEPLVQFEDAQPNNSRELNQIPRKLIGKYYSSEDNTELEITKNIFIKKMILTDTVNISELGNNEILKGDSIFNKVRNFNIKVSIINDSLFTNYQYLDTIFNLKQKDVLKRFKGYYFLNKYDQDNNSWEILKLKLSKGILNINSISTENEIDILNEITETGVDNNRPFRVKLTKKQVREFVKENGFSEGEIYIKK